MQIRYSKPSKDVSREFGQALKAQKELFLRQARILNGFKQQPKRQECILCRRKLSAQGVFKHRTLDFVQCNYCGHIQTSACPPKDYPKLGFNLIYPRLTAKQYQDRKARIYQPKLAWAIKALCSYGLNVAQLKRMSWFEIGCGAGYFLSCLQDYKIKDIYAIDQDKTLVDLANKRLKKKVAAYFNGQINEVFLKQANIYVAFFVFEHLRNPYDLLLALKELPKGTILIFSVPVFGMSCLIENIFRDNYARNLDAVMHTQLYTDRSIDFMLFFSGFAKIAEWVFGEDALDLARVILAQAKGTYPQEMYESLQEKLINAVDRVQEAFDLQRLSDQRHIIAVKR